MIDLTYVWDPIDLTSLQNQAGNGITLHRLEPKIVVVLTIDETTVDQTALNNAMKSQGWIPSNSS